MAYSYRLLAGAQNDFESIVTYLLSISDGTSAAQSFVDEFNHQIMLVCENPMLHGLFRLPELATLGYRAMQVHNYIALYFFRDNAVYIAHIFHQMQDYANLTISRDSR